MSSRERHGGPTPVSHTSRMQVTFWLLTKADYWGKPTVLWPLSRALGRILFPVSLATKLVVPLAQSHAQVSIFHKAKSAHSRMKP